MSCALSALAASRETKKEPLAIISNCKSQSATVVSVIGLTRDLAAQWTGRKKIRVNALAPGFFPSEMSDELPKDMVEMLKMFTPAGRLGEPEELAATLIWLVSDASSYVTGITVPVDGGLVMP